MTKLTKRSVEAILPSSKDRILFDSVLPGFGLRISPMGRKSFVVQYRSGGRTRRISLGRFGTVTCDQARRRAKELLGAVAGGEDPAEQRNSERHTPTVNTLAARFLSEHVETHCKERTMHDYKRLLEAHILPQLGSHRIPSITRADIARFHGQMSETPYQANRALAVLSKMFTLAEIWGLRPELVNPCHLIKKYPEKKKERYLTKNELAALVTVLDERYGQGFERLSVVSALKMLIFTGCRLSEIQLLKWGYVKPGLLVLPDSKTGARRIPICDQAIAILDKMPRALHSDYVFWADGPRGFVTDYQKPWRRIRQAANLDDVRIHDLRHTFASHAVQQGVPLQLVGKLLGHSQLQTTMRYAHLADEDVRAAAATVGSVFSNLISEKGKKSA